MTIIVNLFGGPGTGKSTTAAALFAELKYRGVECELVREYAKDVVWEGSTNILDNQLKVFAEQHHRMFNLIGKVDFIITDAPLHLCLYYGRECGYHFHMLVNNEIDQMENVNVYLNRVKEFKPKGRLQTRDEAVAIDEYVKRMDIHFDLTTNADIYAARDIMLTLHGRYGNLFPRGV